MCILGYEYSTCDVKIISIIHITRFFQQSILCVHWGCTKYAFFFFCINKSVHEVVTLNKYKHTVYHLYISHIWLRRNGPVHAVGMPACWKGSCSWSQHHVWSYQSKQQSNLPSMSLALPVLQRTLWLAEPRYAQLPPQYEQLELMSVYFWGHLTALLSCAPDYLHLLSHLCVRHHPTG